MSNSLSGRWVEDFTKNQIATRRLPEYDDSWLLQSADLRPFIEQVNQTIKHFAAASQGAWPITITTVGDGDSGDQMWPLLPLAEQPIPQRGTE